MTLYLIDANVLIRAHGDYYPIDRIGAFWQWLAEMAQLGAIKMPRENYDEVAGYSDPLGQWLRRPDIRQDLVLGEQTSGAKVRHVIVVGYAPDLDAVEQSKMGRDPFLIAAALGNPDRIVVTREVSKPSKTRGNRHIPDVCATLGVTCINDFELWKRLDFRLP
jgi:hypothetical protein